jgi:hypothetical protein
LYLELELVRQHHGELELEGNVEQVRLRQHEFEKGKFELAQVSRPGTGAPA